MRLLLTILPLLSFGQMPLDITHLPGDFNAPGRGAQYWNGTPWDGIQAPTINGSATGFTGYVRLEWDDVEPTKDNYKLTGPYPSLEFWIRRCIDRGEAFAFGGVMTVCDGCGNTSYDGGRSLYPLYLHQMMQAEAVKDWRTSGGYWIPNWNSPSYLARFQALNDTIAKFVKNGIYTTNKGRVVRYKDVLDYVDVRGYGNFGEWHNWPYDGEMPIATKPTAQTLKNIIDVTVKAFPDAPLVIVAGVYSPLGSSANPPEAGYYALTASNNYGKIGWRRDNIGGPGDDAYLVNNTSSYNGMRFDTAVVYRWKYAMITGEPLNGNGTCCPLYYDIRREIKLYHYAGFGNGNYGSGTSWDTIRKAFALTGYRYQLSGSVDSILYNTTSFNIRMNWKNTGATPMYQKRWRVKYNLVNSAGVTVQRFTSKADLYLLMDGSYSEAFMVNVPATGTYKLSLTVEDTTGYFNPLPLNINTRNADGSYTVATVQVKNPQALPITDPYVRPIRNNAVIKIYPNPVNTELNVELAKNTSKPVSVDIYDVTGRLIMQQTNYSDNFKINTSQLKDGIYIFKLYNRYNIIQTIEKLVKWR